MRIIIVAAAAVALAAPAAAHGATLTKEGDALVVRATDAGESIYLDDSFNPPDPSQLLRFDGDAVFTEVPQECAQRQDTMVDCPVPARVRIELGAGGDRFGILNQLSVDLDELVVDGGDGDDSLSGDHERDRAETLLGGAGRDAIDGFGGNDVVDGGANDDRIEGNAGNDRVLGGEGNDELAGDDQAPPGDDVIDGGGGSDIVKDYTEFGTEIHPPADVSLDGVANDGRPGEADNITSIERYIAYVNGYHVLTDGPEDWQIWSNVSSGGDSTVEARGGDDKIVAEDGTETIDGGAGDDYIEGGKNHDVLTGGPGRDTIFGDDTDSSCNPNFPESCVQYGNDVIEARDGDADQIDCGPGNDRAVVDAADVVAASCEIIERGGEGGGGSKATFIGPRGGRIAKALSKGLVVRFSGISAGGRAKATVGGKLVAAGKLKVGTGSVASAKLRFNKAARKLFAGKRKVKLVVTGGGARGTVTLKR